MKSLPYVSIVIPNYNGAKYLSTCLEALRAQTYPADRFEVIVSDNGSTDASIELLRAQYPWVKVIENGRNLGFAKACNVGIMASQGDYIALLNNDTKVDPEWLLSLVEIAETDERIGACTSKVLLWHDRLTLNIEIFPDSSSCDGGTTLGSQIVHSLEVRTIDRDGEKPVEFLKRFCSNKFTGSEGCHNVAEKFVLGLPVAHRDDMCLELRLSPPSFTCPVRVILYHGDESLADYVLESGTNHALCLSIPKELLQKATPVIQNAGSLVSLDGSGWDRGAIVEGPFHYYEADQGQYNQVEEVFAACGAACLYRRAMLEDVGLLDERFFLYYEDTDLSWRARLRGWKIIYVPQAIVRHVHCGTSGEWSPLFTFHVKKNRLAMVIKNGSWKQVLLAWAGYIYDLIWLAGSWLRSVKSNPSLSRKIAQQIWITLKSGLWVIAFLPQLLSDRIVIQRRRCVPQDEIERMMAPAPPGKSAPWLRIWRFL
jgi:GT2 family glycosyltransferase